MYFFLFISPNYGSVGNLAWIVREITVWKIHHFILRVVKCQKFLLHIIFITSPNNTNLIDNPDFRVNCI